MFRLLKKFKLIDLSILKSVLSGYVIIAFTMLIISSDRSQERQIDSSIVAQSRQQNLSTKSQASGDANDNKSLIDILLLLMPPTIGGLVGGAVGSFLSYYLLTKSSTALLVLKIFTRIERRSKSLVATVI